MKKERAILPVGKILLNEGQLDWLPRNPRTWTQTEIDNTAASIAKDPDFLEDRPLLLVEYEAGRLYIVFAGNLRHEGSVKNKMKEVPCIIYYPKTKEDYETVKRRAALDNVSFGHWDYDELANNWDDIPWAAWGVHDWMGDAEGHEQGDGEGDGLGEDEKPKEPKEKIEFVEELLNEAMRENVREAVEQIDYTMKRGWIASFFTKGAACAKFLRAKYYGEHYPQYLSLYFCPERFYTSANTRSCYDQFRKIADGADDGIAGLRTVSGDNLLLLLLKGSYPFGAPVCRWTSPLILQRI